MTNEAQCSQSPDA